MRNRPSAFHAAVSKHWSLTSDSEISHTIYVHSNVTASATKNSGLQWNCSCCIKVDCLPAVEWRDTCIFNEPVEWLHVSLQIVNEEGAVKRMAVCSLYRHMILFDSAMNVTTNEPIQGRITGRQNFRLTAFCNSNIFFHLIQFLACFTCAKICVSSHLNSYLFPRKYYM